jgi:hypothetical protein
MKTMTCKQLGGACDKEFTTSTFDEMAELSRLHGIEMMQCGEKGHLKAMTAMQNLMKMPVKMEEWFENKKKEFEGS